MAIEKEFQKIITRDDIVVYENHKYYLVKRKENHKYYLVKRKAVDHDNIYPKKEWTFREVLDDIGVKADSL